MERLISLNAAIDAAIKMFKAWYGGSVLRDTEIRARFEALPPAQPTIHGYSIEKLEFIAAVMEKEGMSPEEVVAIFRDLNRVIEMILEDMEETWKKALEQWEGAKDGIAEEAEKEV